MVNQELADSNLRKDVLTMKDCRIGAIAASVFVEATLVTAFWFLTIGVTYEEYFLFLFVPGILVAGVVGIFVAILSHYLWIGGDTRKCGYVISLAVLSVIAGLLLSLFGFPQLAKMESQSARLIVAYSLHLGVGILAATTLHLIVFFALRLFRLLHQK